MLQMHMGMEIRLINTRGTNTKIHACLEVQSRLSMEFRVKLVISYLPLAKLSATRSSNISKSKWVAKLISIALYWMYSSAFNRFWGLRHQTKDPTMAPATEKLEKIKYFSKIWYYTVWKIQNFSLSLRFYMKSILKFKKCCFCHLWGSEYLVFGKF